MPTKKQRRRRAKDRRHEYEYVYVDEEGRELDADELPETVGAGRDGAKREARAPQPRNRAGRPIQPPSWRRVLKRGLIFAPFMYLLLYILPGSAELSEVQRIQQTVFLLMIFLPFSYLMDNMTYRMFQRRQAKLEGGGRGEKR